VDLAFVLLLLGATGVIVLGAGGTAVALSSVLQVQHWRFVYLGRTIEVRNSLLAEVIKVDGERVPTERDGDGLRYVRHVLRLDNGRVLRIWIRANGASATCLADDGAEVVFASDAPPERVTPEEDPRLLAARVLLTDLAAFDARAAGDLEVALERMVSAERAARSQAAAHAALGGDGEELVLRRTLELDELLAALRELHLALMRDDQPARAVAQRALARMGAMNEVERVG
jgi:hypothetical protein